MQDQSTSTAQRNARALRRGMTDSERKLWSALRREQLGVKFRRQHPLGNYIADFACLSPKLIVELDGSQHMEQQNYDARREAFFAAQGFAILRFSSNEPMVNMPGVLMTVFEKLKALAGDAPIPTFPQWGKEKVTRNLP
jgi:BirA family biotin operon repressor/biotin-[acetyl-CoA-carboxylase] ligase